MSRIFALVVLLAVASAARVNNAFQKTMQARNLAAAGLPDPTCKTGILSVPTGSDEPQACCAGYCKECTDYPTCKEVRGQDSEGACCASKVLELKCGDGAPANKCLKPCKKAVPPCIMEPGEKFTTPDPSARSAAEDCNEAVADWRKRAANAMEEGEKKGKE
eukprot:gnl/TRDRNA2_/TRDRNA2_179999_c0_seq1.p2 gnl/TRDRNA2_/TRDRNA2_179999_c0~~gnl/TRDRNA2_/TRDRNA2_179999_c0_seq1.p2  ORF type:complete len:162 (+),score=48.24 gnl/TRDRNA2_/TRDRNA2_179999_c0_seq1:81-566(+)